MGQPAHSRNPYEYINPYSWIDPSPSMATQSISWPGVIAHGGLPQQTVGSNQISMDRIESISQGLLNRSPKINISRYPPPNQGFVAFSGWWLSIWPRVKRKHLQGVYVLLESILLKFGMSLQYRACDPYHRDDLQQGCSQPPATTGDSGLLSAVYKLYLFIKHWQIMTHKPIIYNQLLYSPLHLAIYVEFQQACGISVNFDAWDKNWNSIWLVVERSQDPGESLAPSYGWR
jgi:hypothetical protein